MLAGVFIGSRQRKSPNACMGRCGLTWGKLRCQCLVRGCGYYGCTRLSLLIAELASLREGMAGSRALWCRCRWRRRGNLRWLVPEPGPALFFKKLMTHGTMKGEGECRPEPHKSLRWDSKTHDATDHPSEVRLLDQGLRCSCQVVLRIRSCRSCSQLHQLAAELSRG